MKLITRYFILVVCASVIITNFIFAQTAGTFEINGQNISIEYNEDLYSRVISKINGDEKILGDFTPSEFINIDGIDIQKFKFKNIENSVLIDSIGKGKKYKIISFSKDLKKTVTIKSYDNFPAMLFMKVKYTNESGSILHIDSWTNNNYQFNSIAQKNEKESFWAYLPGTYGWENDWIQPLKTGFKRENYLGMNWVDYGGGTPVLDIWRNDVGIAIGHVEQEPKIISFPTSIKTGKFVSMSLTVKELLDLKPGESFSTFETFVSIHSGDCYQILNEFSKFMTARGIKFRNSPEEAYQPIWCGWEYEKDFTVQELLNTLPEIKKLGLKWVVLDFGWSTGLGDYKLDEKKFPHGDTSIMALVDSIHSIGAKAKLWLNPLAVYPSSELFLKHPEYLLLNNDGSPEYIQYWNSFFLCPAYSEVQKYACDFITKALKIWGFDGFKIDGNNLNMVPPCYNPAHHHASPDDSFEELPKFFNMIYETALNINPNAVVEICPCGTNQSFYILPYMNQTVASDPQNSWQVRMKGKVLKSINR